LRYVKRRTDKFFDSSSVFGREVRERGAGKDAVGQPAAASAAGRHLPAGCAVAGREAPRGRVRVCLAALLPRNRPEENLRSLDENRSRLLEKLIGSTSSTTTAAESAHHDVLGFCRHGQTLRTPGGSHLLALCSTGRVRARLGSYLLHTHSRTSSGDI